uniref:HMA domain-containing protein n=1 Tax=Chenopodium quinoa TaxID=63459 RepID=A0A803M064_CHEQI
MLKLDVHDEKCKQRAMKMASSVTGLDSISMDMKEKKLTLTGDIDPVALVSKLRKVYHTEIVSVGPAKEPEKKKDEPKKQEPKSQAQVGIDSISMDIKARKLTIIGDMDPITVVKKLRKRYSSQIISVGPAKEPEKPKEAPKKPEEPKSGVPVIQYVHPMQAHNFGSNTYYIDPYYSRYNGYAYARSVEEDPVGCVIC